MSNEQLTAATVRLKSVLLRAQSGDPSVADITRILEAKDVVIPRYRDVFSPDRLDDLSEDTFREFLMFRNNQHWNGLHRLGPKICNDMPRLREALQILLDEQRALRERLDTLIPVGKAAFVPGLGKAVLTAILLIHEPSRYGVWNRIAEESMRSLQIWPDTPPKIPFGERYVRVNDVLLRVAGAVGVDLWTLDALWWQLAQTQETTERASIEEEGDQEEKASHLEPKAAFALEQHLQHFLCQNWENLQLSRDWLIFEADGDPEAGREYTCDVGRIDLLCRHHDGNRWLVIELKRNQSSDQALGQVQRYMGWVKQNLAQPGDAVQGMIICRGIDDHLRYALVAASGVEVRRYSVQFQLDAVSHE